jgi:hypothetical protein
MFIIWNFKTPVTLFASLIWNFCEFFDVSLENFAPIVFALMIGSKNFHKNVKMKTIKEKCECEKHGKTVWRIGSTGICLRCGKTYLKK